MEKKVIELFAGVGGFRIGLNDVKIKRNKVIENGKWDFVWANQWEPSSRIQPAFDCYNTRFGQSEFHINKDISKVSLEDIPNHNLLVGGFPCQDYSVARPLNSGGGIQGKKGVLWWEIYKIIEHHKTPFLLLENVDRLLKSPASQRGRDFGIMLKSLYDLGYGVQWRVINAAHYSSAQRRRRIFIFAYKNNTNYYNSINDLKENIYKTSVFAELFPVDCIPNKKRVHEFKLSKDELYKYTDNFKENFYKSGIMHNGNVLTIDTIAIKEKIVPIKKIMEKHVESGEFYLTNKQIEKHKYLKGSKRILRKKPNGESYYYSEGSMQFPDDVNQPGRTMLTSEGTINRSSHVVRDFKTENLRKITPLEAERLNGFPDNWTDTGMTTRQRYFMMGNALVVSIVKRLESRISDIFENE